MIISRTIFVVLLVASSISCDRQQDISQQLITESLEGDSLMPVIGQDIIETTADKNENILIMVSSSDILPSYKYDFKGVNFELGVENGVIKYISTNDRVFSSSEGIRMGDTYESVVSITGRQAVTEQGWGYYVKLASGWHTAFFQGKTVTEGDLRPETKVSWFFQR